MGDSTYVAVSYFVDNSRYSNVGVGSSGRSQNVYWRNIAVMLASASRQFGAGAELLVFSNALPPPDIGQLLARLRADVVVAPFGHAPPPGYFPRFRGAFYLFDVLEHMATRMEPTDRLIVVDPDCVWIGDPQPLLDRLDRDGVLAYEVPYEPDYVKLGTSRRLMGEIFEEVSGQPAGVPAYIGGELCGLKGGRMPEILGHLAEIWEACLGRHRDGLPKLNTEEQMLSYAVWRAGLTRGNANGLVKRVWTSSFYRNVSTGPRPSEFDLVLWHMPAEKKRGMLRLYRSVLNDQGPFWTTTGEDYIRHLATRVGVMPTQARRLSDTVRRSAVRMKYRLRPDPSRDLSRIWSPTSGHDLESAGH